jgi:transposase-like protein
VDAAGKAARAENIRNAIHNKLETGRSYEVVAAEFGIDDSTLRRWTLRYADETGIAVPGRRK